MLVKFRETYFLNKDRCEYNKGNNERLYDYIRIDLLICPSELSKHMLTLFPSYKRYYISNLYISNQLFYFTDEVDEAFFKIWSNLGGIKEINMKED